MSDSYTMITTNSPSDSYTNYSPLDSHFHSSWHFQRRIKRIVRPSDSSPEQLVQFWLLVIRKLSS